jgi:hypothetical protein
VVHKFSIPLPILTVGGPSTSPKAAKITFMPALGFPPCLPLNGQWHYEWSMPSLPVASATNPPNGAATIPSLILSTAVHNLVFPANSLTAGYIYRFQLVVTPTGGQAADGSVQSSISIEITPSALAALIAGGNPLVSASMVLVLDASFSSDPDTVQSPLTTSPIYDFTKSTSIDVIKDAADKKAASTKGEEAELSYQWSCAIIPTLNYTDTNTDCGDQWLTLDTTAATLAIPVGLLLDERQYTFGVTVSGSYNRSVTTSIVVTTDVPVLSSTSPILSVALWTASVSSRAASAALLTSVAPGTVATNEPLRMIGYVSLLQGDMDNSTFKYIWSEVKKIILSITNLC